jgi:hypothetical protein
MMIDANDQAAYAISGGVPLTFASANSILYSYTFVEFADVTVTTAYFDDLTVEPD